MAGSYERKTREIKKSLHKRARMRRAYFKMIGEDSKKPLQMERAQRIESEENSLDVSDSEEEGQAPVAQPKSKKPKGKVIASQKRAEKYHKQKEAEKERLERQEQRERHKKVMQKRTPRGQPRLNAQMSVLLDKIKSTK